MQRPVLARAALVGLLALAASGAASASDDAAWKDLESRYRKLAKNKDEDANRERRQLILRTFDFLDQKSSRKFLRDAYGEEPTPDGRIAVVQVLAASGDPKDGDFLLGALKKEKLPGPAVALAQGLSFTAPAQAPSISAWAAAQAAKQKGEPQRSLLEGLGELADPSATAPLRALAGKLDDDSEFERLVALGACGRAAAKDDLDRASLSQKAEIRLAAALGLGRTGGPDQPPDASVLPALCALLADADARVVEAAADALARTKHEPAVKPLADALPMATLRTREALRAALRAITGRDAGHDPAAWQKADGTAPAPRIPAAGGMPVPSSQVALLLDLSRSMSWAGRLEQGQKALNDFVRTLPDDAAIGAIAAARTPVLHSDKLVAGAQAKTEVEAWISKQLTAGGCDMREALLTVPRQWPTVDTVVIATDSAPWGDSADHTPLEVMQEFRRENRHHRIRVFVIFVAPGGRQAQSEPSEAEYADRKELLRQFAESTGGKFVALE